MKVGILSDSHDHRGAAQGALLLFRAEGVGMAIHLGDVCSPVVLAGYGDPAIPFLGVFGNNDSDRDGLQEATGGAFRQGPRIETVDGRKILFAHSYNQLQGELSGQGRFDLVLFGHTHRPLTMRVGKALVVVQPSRWSRSSIAALSSSRQANTQVPPQASIAANCCIPTT